VEMGSSICRRALVATTHFPHIFVCIFHIVWQKEKFPKEWKEGIIIKVPKK
jgi:hypothetical protein